MPNTDSPTTDGSGATNGVLGGVTEAAHVGDERTTLVGFLQRQRDLVTWKMRDASDQTLSSVRMPSGLTLPGVVKHLTNVERGWIRAFFGGQTGLSFDSTDEDPDADFHAEGVPMADLLAAYAAETALCDQVIAAAPSLDTTATDEDAHVLAAVDHRAHDRGDRPSPRPHRSAARACRRRGRRRARGLTIEIAPGVDPRGDFGHPTKEYRMAPKTWSVDERGGALQAGAAARGLVR